MGILFANEETFVITAWLLTHGTSRAAFLEELRACQLRGKAAEPGMFLALLQKEWQGFSEETMWADLLLRSCLVQADPGSVALALCGTGSLCFRQDERTKPETRQFWEVVASDVRASFETCRWPDTCTGARALRDCFLAWGALLVGYHNAPPVVTDLLRIGLERLDWHLIASFLRGHYCPSCLCLSQPPNPVKPAGCEVFLAGQLLRLLSEQIRKVAQALPEQKQVMALFVGDLCRTTAEVIAQGEEG